MRTNAWLPLLVLVAVLSAPAGARELKVGVAGAPPFVIIQGAQVDGLSVQIWAAVAQDLGMEYRLVPLASEDEALKAVRRAEVDVLVGPVAITAARLSDMAFSQPYFHSSLGILTTEKSDTLVDKIRPFLTLAAKVGASGLVTLLLLVGTLLWLAERRDEKSLFSRDFWPGIYDGIWLALTTMSTVGYGDRYPVTGAGRLVASIWILLSMGMVSTLTATIATTFTLSQIGSGPVSSAEMLAGKRVAVVRGSTAQQFVYQHRAQVILEEDLDKAVMLLQQGVVEAVVHDRPALLYYCEKFPNQNLLVSSAHYEPQSYGFATPLDSSLAHSLNVALLELYEQGALNRITSEWLGDQ